MDKGSVGYIDSVKRKNLKYAIIGLSAMVVLYFTGLVVVGSNGSSWTLFSVLIALPAAQFLTRYISLRGFSSLPQTETLELDHLKPEAIAYELALVIGKKTYYVRIAVITENQITLYSTDSDITSKIVMDLLRQKGILNQVQICKDMDSLKKTVKSLQMMGTTEAAEIKETLIGNAL